MTRGGPPPFRCMNAGFGSCGVCDGACSFRLTKREGVVPPLRPGGVPSPSPPFSKRSHHPPPAISAGGGPPPLRCMNAGFGSCGVCDGACSFRLTKREGGSPPSPARRGTLPPPPHFFCGRSPSPVPAQDRESLPLQQPECHPVA